jgi:hypothetical protein
MTEQERTMLRRLADKWEGEAENYERRQDDDYGANAMMLRYCAVQLHSAVPAERQHEWQFYANGSFCRRCGASIGDQRACR